MMKQKLRIAFIGCGQFCRFFVPLFKVHPAVEFVAVCDKFRERAQEFKETFGADMLFDTFEEAIASRPTGPPLNFSIIAISKL